MDNTIDDFMDKIDEISSMDPLKMRKDVEIAQLVAYQRKMRQNFEAGIKPKRETGKAGTSLADLMKKKSGDKPAAPSMIRRV